MLELGVDELTLVIQATNKTKVQSAPNESTSFKWGKLAERLIQIFLAKTNFENIFGKMIPELKVPQGYEFGYKFGEHNFYLVIAYHPSQMNMGIIVKFSAQALDFYCETTGLKVYEFLQSAVSNKYTIRLSRIDLTADYINERINTSMIYQDLMDNKVGIFREYVKKSNNELGYKRCMLDFQGLIKKSDVPTIYIGSVQSNSRLRIYDKRREQIEKNGTKLDKAKKCHDWVRFEAVFRHEFAHQLSDELLNITSEYEFANMIACTLVQKFRFMNIDNGVIDCETEYTQMLIECINNKKYILRSPSSRNYELPKSLRYLLHDSGMMNTFYKVYDIWGNEALEELMQYIMEYFNDWEPNKDCLCWLEKNRTSYKKDYPDFNKFLNENLSVLINQCA